MHNNAIVPLIAFVLFFVLAILVLTRGQRHHHRTLFSIFLFSMAQNGIEIIERVV